MFNSLEDIYYCIAQNIINALPDEWEHAYLDVIVYEVDHSLAMGGVYTYRGEEIFFDVECVDGVKIITNTDKAFFELYKNMQVNSSDKPWNKCRFELECDGEFDLKFKFDYDFDWYNGLGCDSADFEMLSYEVIELIESWEGLPTDFNRFWKI